MIGCCPRPYSATCQYQAGGRPRQPEEQSSRCGLQKLPLHLPLPHAALTSLLSSAAMLDLESPPPLMRARPTTQEKRLRKRRELDALVKDVGSHHGRRRGGRGNSGQELLGGSKDCSSSDGSGVGEDHRHERLGVAVWRGGSGRQYFTLWWGLKWGLGASTVFLLASITIWLHINTRAELDVVRRHIVRGESCCQRSLWVQKQWRIEKALPCRHWLQQLNFSHMNIDWNRQVLSLLLMKEQLHAPKF